MIRKRLSQVKAGRFAQIAAPAKIFSIILSDVLGDRLDTIASGPCAPDDSTIGDALKVAEKYGLNLTKLQLEHLVIETPKKLHNVKWKIIGSVATLCSSASKICSALGYMPYVLSTTINCEAREAGRFLGQIAADIKNGTSYFRPTCAIIIGGETVVNVKGSGKGGRNQELALAAAVSIKDMDDVLIFSLGSDGTDGPTDAAGAIVMGDTIEKLKEKGISVDKVLANNDAYHALQAIDALIMTGPTGTNVNDVSVVLVL